MNTRDPALSLSNPRLLSAVYFSLLAIIATIVIDSVLYELGVQKILPIFQAILLAVVVAACFGALFGERIIHTPKPYRSHAFLWAFFMVIVSLPFYNLGFIYLLQKEHIEAFAHVNFMHLVYLYWFVLGYSFIIAGLWLAIIAGVAAIYLRGYLVYHMLSTLSRQRHVVRRG